MWKIPLALCLTLSFAASAQTVDGGIDATPPAEVPPASAPESAALPERLGALEEAFNETRNSVLSMEKLKLGGYVQGRYQNAQNSAAGVDGKGATLVKDGFSVRRARLKATYTGKVSQLVFEVDAVPTGVSAKDIEVHLIEPWTGHKLELVVGQMKYPFGFETPMSSGDFEFPELSRASKAFLASERDLGAKLKLKLGILRAQVGVFNGNGVGNNAFIGVDNDLEKDVIGRLGVDLKWFALGVSGWAGKTYRSSDYSGEVTIPGTHFTRNRIGADTQFYLDALPFGATQVRGEFYAGTTYQKGGVEQFGQTGLGWYATVLQNIGLRDMIGVRYDYFDGATGTPSAVDSKDATKPAGTNPIGTLGLLVMHHFDEHLKATLAYEIPMTVTGGEGAKDPADNLLTVQLQARF